MSTSKLQEWTIKYYCTELSFWCQIKDKKTRYLEEIEGHLLLDTKVTDFIMIYKIKVYILSYLFPQILISSNLKNHIKRVQQSIYQNTPEISFKWQKRRMATINLDNSIKVSLCFVSSLVCLFFLFFLQSYLELAGKSCFMSQWQTSPKNDISKTIL